MAFEFLNVSIGAAMVVPEETNSQIEIHTSLSARKLPQSISRLFGTTLQYPLGMMANLRCIARPASSARRNIFKHHLTCDPTAHEGLCWRKVSVVTGMRTDGNRATEASLPPKFPERFKSGTKHIAPLVTDVYSRPEYFGGTAGDVRSLRAYLPVFTQSCRIYTPNFGETEAIIHPSHDGFATSSRWYPQRQHYWESFVEDVLDSFMGKKRFSIK
ncbi:unnamed protein product, partial [Clonostachys rosea f. rosea IK726]